MPDYPDTIPQGYVRGASGSRTDPDTGEVSSWSDPPQPRYVPPPPQQFEINPDAVAELFKNKKADEARKEIQAAQAYLAQRGYQNDITQAALETDPLKKAALQHAAALKWIPVMVGGKGMSALLRPPPALPSFMRGTNGAPDSFQLPGHLPSYPPKPTPPAKPMHIGDALVTIGPDGTPTKVYQAPAKPQFDTTKTTLPATDAVKASKGFLYTGWGAHPAKEATPARVVTTRTPQAAPLSAQAQAAPAPAAAVAPSTVVPAPARTKAAQDFKIGDVYKGYRLIGSDLSKKESWEKVQ